MRPLRLWAGIIVVGMSFALQPAIAQKNSPHIGYVYPAGGRVDSTFEVVVGGQFLAGLTNVLFSGSDIQAAIVDMDMPISSKELNNLRIQVDELLARKAVVQNNFKALENFRSFKNSKSIKKDTEAEDKEIEELKKKYAGAKWTDEDEQLLSEARKRIAMAVRKPENPAISEIATLRVTVAKDAKPGDREVRLVTSQGLTNPMLFKIGQLPEFTKPASKTIQQRQKNREMPTARKIKPADEKAETTISLPSVVNGQILPGAVDRFVFNASKGMKLVIASSARELIPYIADAVPGWFQATLTLKDQAGREVAYNDDFRFNPDPALYYEIPADGKYVLEIRDSIYRGREDFVYRIVIGELPFITGLFPLGGKAGSSVSLQVSGWNLPASNITFNAVDKSPGIYPVSVQRNDWISNITPFAVDNLPEIVEKEPDSQHRTAQAVTLPLIINGTIDHPDDRDFFKFDAKAGDEIIAEVYARRLNSPLDSKLVISDSQGRQISCNDDCEDKSSGLETHHADSCLRTRLPSNGTYFVEIVDTQHQGGPEFAYRLRVSPPQPDFSLRVVPSSINIRAGGTVPVTLYALRQDGFTNAISISLKDAPAGFKLSGTIIQATQEQARITLTAPAAGRKEPVTLNFEGWATINGKVVTHPAIPAEDMMQAFAYRHLVPSKELCVGIGNRLAQKAAATITSNLPLKIPAGGTTALRLDIARNITTNTIEWELSDPPEGIAIKRVVQSGTGMEIILAVDAGKLTAGQKGNLIISAFAHRSGKNSKTPSAASQRFQVATLPAVPFEIVSP